MNHSAHSIHYLEMVTPDKEAVRAAYEASLQLEFGPDDPSLGQACVARLPNGTLLGIRAPMHADEAPAVRPYFRVDNLEASVRQVVSSGANVLLDNMELPGHGSIAVYELGGVQHGLWQVA